MMSAGEGAVDALVDDTPPPPQLLEGSPPGSASGRRRSALTVDQVRRAQPCEASA